MAGGAQLALAHRSLPGDGLLWQHGGNRWWWADVPAATLHAWQETGRSPAAWRLPEQAGSFAFCRSGRLLVGLAKWLCFADVPGATTTTRPLALQPVVAVDPAEPRTRLADGRTDRRGHFVFGTRIAAQEPRAIGSFYQYSQVHGLRRLALPAAVAAGSICFSPDGATMYFSTGERRIMCCDYDADSAQVAGIRLFAELAHGVPHGATVDSEGCVWSAGQGSGQLLRHAPDGERIGAWALPAPCATRPAFGGAALDCLMVGSAAAGHDGNGRNGRNGRDKGGGSLFRLALPGVRGMPDMPFDDGLEPWP